MFSCCMKSYASFRGIVANTIAQGCPFRLNTRIRLTIYITNPTQMLLSILDRKHRRIRRLIPLAEHLIHCGEMEALRIRLILSHP